MQDILGRNWRYKTSRPTLNQGHPQCMKITKSPKNVNLSIFIMTFYIVCGMFGKGITSGLISYNSEMAFRVIIFNIESESSEFGNALIINEIFILWDRSRWLNILTFLWMKLLCIITIILRSSVLLLCMSFNCFSGIDFPIMITITVNRMFISFWHVLSIL